MIEPLEINTTRIPSDQGLAGGPLIMVVPSLKSAPTDELYLRFGNAPVSCRSQESVAAIVSTGALNSPDRVAATGGRLDEGVFELVLEIRAFDGPLAANDPWIALVRVELGALKPGEYQFVVRETVLRFTDLDHPESATDPATSERRISFDCL
jgi:hypothetical protein